MARPPVSIFRLHSIIVVLLVFLTNLSTADLVKEVDCSPKPELPCRMYFMNKNVATTVTDIDQFHLKSRSDVCEVTTSDCGFQSLMSRFPNAYKDSDTFPNVPNKFTVTRFQEEWKNSNYYYQGVNVTIHPPVDSSMEDLLGFEITFIKMSSISPSCLIFIFNFTGGLSPEDVHSGLTFNGRVYPVSGQSTYYFRAYSLPKPLPQYDKYQDLFITTGMYKWNNKVPSADWYTSITYRNDSANSVIDITFDPPPKIYNFQHFRILLTKGDNLGGKLVNDSVVHSANISDFNYSFKDVSPGWYVVKITPIDTEWQNYKKCLCKNSNNGCYSCLSTLTVPLLITDERGETTHRDETKEPIIPTAQGVMDKQHHTQTSPEVIASAVLGSVLGLILVVMLLFSFVYYRRRNNPDENQTPDNGHITFIEEKNRDLGNGCTNSAFVVSNGSATPWKKKKIFLVNSDDHHKHLDVVKAFAQFLTKECRCEVIFAPNCNISNRLQWVVNSIDQSDYVILINSAAAFLHFDAWKKNKPGNYCQPLTRAGDIFGPAVQEIADRFMRNCDISKTLSVQFDYTPNKFLIKDVCMGRKYNLLKHIEEFLCHIHGLQLHQNNLLGMGLPTSDTISTIPSGITLHKAIEKALKFEERESLNRCDSGIANDEETSPLDIHIDGDGNLHVNSQQNYENSDVADGPMYDYAIQEIAKCPTQTDVPQRQYDYANVKKRMTNQTTEKSDPMYQNTSQSNLYESVRNGREFEATGGQNDYIEVISGEFHPPSSLGDEDIQSRQLRQDIDDINKRYEQTKQLSEGIEECKSLGGVSV